MSIDPRAVVVPLRSRAGQIIGSTVVDPDDAERVGRHVWRLNAYGYAYRSRRVFLHRELLGLGPCIGDEVDHIDGNPLNNTRTNLRVASHAENLSNRRGPNAGRKYLLPRGVTFDRSWGKFQAYAAPGGRRQTIGRFLTAEAADDAIRGWRAEHMPFSADAKDRENAP